MADRTMVCIFEGLDPLSREIGFWGNESGFANSFDDAPYCYTLNSSNVGIIMYGYTANSPLSICISTNTTSAVSLGHYWGTLPYGEVTGNLGDTEEINENFSIFTIPKEYLELKEFYLGFNDDENSTEGDNVDVSKYQFKLFKNGLYNKKTINISCSTPDSSLYYSIDNSFPSIPYSSNFDANLNTTIKSIAKKEGWIDSEISEFFVEESEKETKEPTSNIPLGTTLNNGDIIFYDRGSSYGTYNLEDNVLTKISETEYTGREEDNNWRFLIIGSQIWNSTNYRDYSWDSTDDHLYEQTIYTIERETIQNTLNPSNILLQSYSDLRKLWVNDLIKYYLPGLEELEILSQNILYVPNANNYTYLSSDFDADFDNRFYTIGSSSEKIMRLFRRF